MMHGRFSRWLGPVPQEKTDLFGWFLLTLVAAAILFAVVQNPLGAAIVISAIAAASYLLERQRAPRVVRAAASRGGEDIGSFARAFDRHSDAPLDPWAIRAVWNALVPLTVSNGHAIPLRPADRFEADLFIDPEDVEELVPLLVEQCERSGGRWKDNPYFTRLNTVADLVHFISAQPLRQVESRSPAP